MTRPLLTNEGPSQSIRSFFDVVVAESQILLSAIWAILGNARRQPWQRWHVGQRILYKLKTCQDLLWFDPTSSTNQSNSLELVRLLGELGQFWSIVPNCPRHGLYLRPKCSS